MVARETPERAATWSNDRAGSPRSASSSAPASTIRSCHTGRSSPSASRVACRLPNRSYSAPRDTPAAAAICAIEGWSPTVKNSEAFSSTPAARSVSSGAPSQRKRRIGPRSATSGNRRHPGSGHHRGREERLTLAAGAAPGVKEELSGFAAKRSLKGVCRSRDTEPVRRRRTAAQAPETMRRFQEEGSCPGPRAV